MENTNEGEASNTVTENAPDMSEFQQASPAEETAETTNEESPANEETTTTEVNENEPKVEESEVKETVEESADAPAETTDAPAETTDAPAETTDAPEETTDAPAEATDAPAKVTDASAETTDAPEATEATAEATDAPEATEATAEATDAPEATAEGETADGPSEAVQETTNEGNGDNPEGTGAQEANTGDEANKESLLVEEVTMTSSIGPVDTEFSRMDGVMAESVNPEESSPITEISQAPEEGHPATEMYEEQGNNDDNNNTLPQNYYSAINNPPPTTKTSVKKPVGVENYKFSSEPRAIPAPSQRRKYRDPYELEKMLSIQKNEFNQEKQRIACNIMYDPRVVRGNTYAAKILPLHSEPDPLERHKQEEMKRRAKARKRAAEKRRIKTPEPVEGRRHVEIQTDLYLEELYDKVPEAIAATQTDLFLDRAPSPLYIPQKSGVDAATQIYDGELFDFDFEVEPILEVLVGKTLEQALIEVMEEEELEMLRKHQVEFEEKRNAELAEVQRLEDAERRRNDEKNRRITEKLKLMKDKKEVAEKIAARSFTNAYLSNLIPSVFETLNDNGFFYDPRETEIENYFLPWLTHKSNNYVDKIRTSRLLLDHIILDSIKQLNDMGRPILRGLKEKKIKKPKKVISVEDWLNPDITFKCVERKPQKY